MSLDFGLLEQTWRKRRQVTGRKQALQITENRVLCREIRVIGRDAIVDMTRCDVLLQLAIELEMALSRYDLDFLTCLFFPQRNAREERLLLDAADQLDPQRVAFVFTVGMCEARSDNTRERKYRSCEPEHGFIT